MQSSDLLLHSSQRGFHWSPTGRFSSALTLALLEFQGRSWAGGHVCFEFSLIASFFPSLWLPLPSCASSWVLGLCVTQRRLICCCSDWWLPRPMGTAAGACHRGGSPEVETEPSVKCRLPQFPILPFPVVFLLPRA